MSHSRDLASLRAVAALSFATAAMLSIMYFVARLEGARLEFPVALAYAVYVGSTAILAAGFAHWYLPTYGIPWFEAVAVPVVVTLLSVPVAAVALVLSAEALRGFEGDSWFRRETAQAVVAAGYLFVLVAWPALLVTAVGASSVLYLRANSVAKRPNDSFERTREG